MYASKMKKRVYPGCFNFCLKIVLLTFFLAIGFSSGNKTNAAELTFLGDFEHGIINLDGNVNPASPWYASGNTPEVVTAPEPVRYGRYAVKSYLNRRNSPISYRTEIVPKPIKKVHVGEHSWYGFSIYFPESWVADNIWEIFAQWHGVPDKGEDYRNPVMAMSTSGNNIKISGRWDSKPITPPPNVKPRYDGERTYYEGPIQKGQWTDWVFHIKWSYGNDGVVEIWRNGVKVSTVNGPNAFNDQKGPYFKMGIYKGWRDRYDPVGIVGERTIYHDEVRFAGADGSYALVSPPSSSPVTYTLTVNSGSGDGSYTAGTDVAITAEAAPAGQHFVNWTTGNGGSFANANLPVTTYTMPANTAAVTANFAPDSSSSQAVANWRLDDG